MDQHDGVWGGWVGGVFSVVIEALLDARRQEVGRVADPGLEGGEQVAVLRLHAASSGRVTFATYSRRSTSLELASHLAKFAELLFYELR